MVLVIRILHVLIERRAHWVPVLVGKVERRIKKDTVAREARGRVVADRQTPRRDTEKRRAQNLAAAVTP